MPRGIPLGFFLGGPYEWTAFDRDVALAYEADRSARCPDCGEYWDDWYDAKGMLRERNPPKKVDRRICGGCRITELTVNAEDEQDKRPGSKRFLVPVEP